MTVYDFDWNLIKLLSEIYNVAKVNIIFDRWLFLFAYAIQSRVEPIHIHEPLKWKVRNPWFIYTCFTSLVMSFWDFWRSCNNYSVPIPFLASVSLFR